MDIPFNFNEISLDKETIQVGGEPIEDLIKAQYLAAFASIFLVMPSERNYDNTVRPLIRANTVTEPFIHLIDYIANLYPDEELRKKAVEIKKSIKEFIVQQVEMHPVLYKYYKEYEGYPIYNNPQAPYQKEKDKLTQEERRFFEKTMLTFRRNGLQLNDEDYETLLVMKQRLEVISTDFSANINAENSSFTFKRDELEGLPESWFNESRRVSDGIYRVTLKYPDYIPIVEYCQNEAVRKQLFLAFTGRCHAVNAPLFKEGIELRHRIAKLLGYQSYVDYVAELKTVKTAVTAHYFETDLNRQFDHPYVQLLDQLKGLNGGKQPELWSMNYLVRLYKERELKVSMEEINAYFSLKKVKEGMFKIYQGLLGLTFTEVPTENKWHSSVTLYRVNDTERGDVLGYFYLDLYPRTGKFSHCAVFGLQASCQLTKTTRRPAVVCLTCNFQEDGCLPINDVKTFFHEFGHVMHQICSQTQLAEFCGFNVETDFLETPSQMLEFWCYDTKALQMMSAHKETGEPIPEELVKKWQRMKIVGNAYFNKRQLMGGLFDLKVHMFDLKGEFDNEWNENENEVMHMTANTPMYASFGHLFQGYEACYYSYMVSESFAAHMFYKKFQGKTLDPEVGKMYRQEVLEVGSSKDAMVILKEFLGEKPDNKYFLMDKGLKDNS